MIKLGSNSIGKIYLGSNSIGKAYLGSNLVFQKGSGPSPVLPYTPVDYIETDGTAYINTGIKGNTPISMSAKMLAVPYTTGNVYNIGCRKDTGNTRVGFMILSEDNYIGWTYGSFTNATAINIASSINNQTPIDVKVSFAAGAQSLSVKQLGDADFTTVTNTDAAAVSDGIDIYIFSYNNRGETATNPRAGNRCYECKFYSDANYTTLVFNGVPCVYNGEYGLWDTVSNSFFGNAAASGAFTGPSIS